MLTVSDPRDDALRAGLLGCPVCPGRLRPWGYARPRLVRRRGEGVWIRPRRARCPECGRTQVLLPSALLARRRDVVADIGVILEAYARGRGYRQAARDLAIPVPTVRNWVRRLRGRWSAVFARFDAGPRPPGGSHGRGRPDDPLAAIRALQEAASRAGWSKAPWEFASVATDGSLLANNTT